MASPGKNARLSAEAKGFTEIVERGRGHLKTRNPVTGHFALDTSTGGAGWHYGAGLEADSAWEVDTGAWQYRMVKAEFNLHARNILNVGDLIEWLDPVSGESVTLQPLGLNWVDNVTNSRQQIAIPQAVTAQVSDDVLHWSNGYGAGIHFQYQAGTSRLIKRIIVDSASSLPTPTVSNPYLEIEFIISKSAGVSLYVDGQPWDNSTQIITANAIEYRLSNGTVVWGFNQPYALDANRNSVIGIFQLRRQGANRYCTVRIPKSWVDQAVFPIVIDPTIDVDTEANSDDGNISPPSSIDIKPWMGYYFGSYSAWIRFPGISGLSGATITTSYWDIEGIEQLGSPNTLIYANDVAAPVAPTSYSDYNSKAVTSANIAWTTGFAPSLNSVIQELADSYDPSAIMFLIKDNGSAANENVFTGAAHDWGLPHLLHIEYSTGGYMPVGIPNLTYLRL